jgi:O-methyltransferase
MKAGLEVFYDRMSPGGIFILHDYSSGWWEGAKRAVDEFLADKPERLILMPDACGTAVFRRG